ncbi:hypothetical protein ACFQZ4_43115 [Catellatospora coxensis]
MTQPPAAEAVSSVCPWVSPAESCIMGSPVMVTSRPCRRMPGCRTCARAQASRP